MFVQMIGDVQWHKLRGEGAHQVLCRVKVKGSWDRATGSLPGPEMVEPDCRALLQTSDSQLDFHGPPPEAG